MSPSQVNRLPRLDDSELTTARLTGATVAILAYNPSPDPREVGVLESFVRRGGKLMVFFGADPALARLMDLTVAPRMVDLKSGRWCSFRSPIKAVRSTRSGSSG